MFMDKTSRLDLKSSEQYDYLFNYKDEIGDMFKSINNYEKYFEKSNREFSRSFEKRK